MKMTATYDSSAGTFRLVKDQWRGTFPISDLPGWVNFYRQQRQRYPDHAASYASDIKALEALARKLRGQEDLSELAATSWGEPSSERSVSDTKGRKHRQNSAWPGQGTSTFLNFG
jgi:hypothetical protein